MIAVTFALPQESKDFVSMLNHAGVVMKGRLPVFLGNLGAREIVVAHTGVGAASAARQIERLLSHYRPRILISTGFAGGLEPRLRIADIVVGWNFSDAKLLAKARGLQGSSIFCGSLTSQLSTVETPSAKRALACETGALAVDMETQTVFDACGRAGIPMLSIRAISDTAEQSLPVPFGIWFDADKQQPRAFALVRHLIQNPALIPDFCRFVSGITSARQSLTSYIVRLVLEL